MILLVNNNCHLKGHEYSFGQDLQVNQTKLINLLNFACFLLDFQIEKADFTLTK